MNIVGLRVPPRPIRLALERAAKLSEFFRGHRHGVDGVLGDSFTAAFGSTPGAVGWTRTSGRLFLSQYESDGEAAESGDASLSGSATPTRDRPHRARRRPERI